MTQRIAWTRLSALALSACLILHAAVGALSHLWLSEAVAALEVAAAVLLASRRTRAIGVIVGAAVLSLIFTATLLGGAFGPAAIPFALIVALLTLGRRIDRERNSAGVRPRHHGTPT